jgi:cysteine desulfurase/selenocysteine lyase
MSALPATSAPALDVARVRADFPALQQTVHDGQPLVYLDNAATSQKPQVVLDRLAAYYGQENSNIHRGVHTLSQQATDAYEQARATMAAFVNAPSTHEVIFTRGTTEAINLVASTFGRVQVSEGDEVVISGMEHHSNIVPWQMLCEQQGARLRVIPINDRGEIDLDAYLDLLGERTKLVALVHISNALGTINPVKRMIAAAHDREIPVLIDGAQAVPHQRVDVQALDADFYCLSGHKMFGPTGVGILYGKEAHLQVMPPYQGGGDMIERVTFERTTYDRLPHKFEAGTPHIAGGLGLAAAANFMTDLGHDAIQAHEDALLAYATERLDALDGLRLIGTAENKASVLSFVLDGVHPYDAGTLLDRQGIAVRTGHHCTQPLMDRLGLEGTIRASLALYNTREDVDALVDALRSLRMTMASNDRTVSAPAPAVAVEETVEERMQDVIDEFTFLDDLNLRREHLMDLGASLPVLDEQYRADDYRIHGCQSKVWLHAEERDGRVRFRADSNAMITKGLIALLVRVLDGQPPQAILEADLDQFLEDIGMEHLISVNRKNGLAEMIKQIKLYALALDRQLSA